MTQSLAQYISIFLDWRPRATGTLAPGTGLGVWLLLEHNKQDYPLSGYLVSRGHFSEPLGGMACKGKACESLWGGGALPRAGHRCFQHGGRLGTHLIWQRRLVSLGVLLLNLNSDKCRGPKGVNSSYGEVMSQAGLRKHYSPAVKSADMIGA